MALRLCSARVHYRCAGVESANDGGDITSAKYRRERESANATRAQTALAAVAYRSGDAVERRDQLPYGERCCHSVALDFAAGRLPAHDHHCLRVPSPAAAKYRFTISDSDAGEFGLRAFKTRRGMAAAH